MKNYTAVCLLLLSLTLTASAEASDPLEAGFRSPPHDAKALTWWHWQDGNITREGITSDLEAMDEAGLAGAYIFSVGLRLPNGPVRFMSPEWIDLVGHAIREAERLGLDFGMHNCDGWSQAGGPWITPQQSMKILTWSSATLEGPKTCSVKLRQPPTKKDFYRDVAVVAFPVPKGTRLNGPGSNVKLSGTLTEAEMKLLVDGKKQTRQNFPRTSGKRKKSIVFEYAEKVTARSLILHDHETYGLGNYETGTLEVSDDGKNYQQLSEFEVNWDTRDAPTGTITIGFKAAAGRFFRFSFIATRGLGFSEIELSSKAYPHLWEAKAGWTRQRDHGGEANSFTNSPAPRNVMLPEGFAVAREDVRIISGKMAADGTLNWDVPEGKWRVLRVGYTSNGKMNRPATKEGNGLECDKLDPAAVRFHMDQYMGKMVERYGDYVGKTFTAFETDSWEAHIQNWTDGFEERFSKAMGYDMLKYLPLLLEGVAIDSLESCEDMMWDWRRFLADQIRENYFMTTHAFAKETGLTYISEGSGRQQYMYDPITYQRDNDVPMGEFWTGKMTAGGWVRVDNKVAASAAHITGRRYVASESYTSATGQAKWLNHPGLLKTEGDIAFTKGVNRIVFHTFSHQPFPEQKPGFVMGKWGMHNHQGNTWFKSAKAWYGYIARCQYLLQQGRFVADVLYYLGEEVPARVGFRNELKPELPGGYDFDACDFQALQEARVVDGIITLPSGMEYKVLLLPQKDAMRPQVVERIAELIEAGAVVVGKMPQRSPSLGDGDAGDARVKQVTERTSGKLYYEMSFEEVFKKLGVVPDFETTNKDVIYIHRKIGNREVYFVCNPTDQQISTQCRFRVADRQAEFWCPDTGVIETAAQHWRDGEHTVMPIRLDPSGSVFVVFGKDKPLPAVRSVECDGKGMDALDDCVQPIVADGKLKALIRQPGTYNIKISSGKKINLQVDNLPKEQVVDGSWSVEFPEYWSKAGKVEFPKLISWHEHADEEVKYFSGTAVYRKSINIPARWQSPERRVVLDLGRVEVIAEVLVNGKKVATLWKPPFEVDITDWLKPGGNELEISVTNLWPNRLIGDERYPQVAELNSWKILTEWPGWLYKGQSNPGPRRTFTTRKIYEATDPLLPSGLIGPVRLCPVAVREIR